MSSSPDPVGRSRDLNRRGLPRVLRGPAADSAARATLRPVVDTNWADVNRDPGVLAAEIQAAREAAQREGFATGLREGRAAGEAAARHELQAELVQRLGTALAALGRAQDELARRDAVSLGEIEPEIMDFAVAVAEAILQRELEAVDGPGREALARALSLAPDRGELVAHLNPVDAATVGVVDDLAPGRMLSVIADAAVEPGGCVLEIGACRVDAQLSAALARVRSVLRSNVRSTS